MEKEIEAVRERAHSPPSGHPQVLSLPSPSRSAHTPVPSHLSLPSWALGPKPLKKQTISFVIWLPRILQPCPQDLRSPAPRHGVKALQPPHHQNHLPDPDPPLSRPTMAWLGGSGTRSPQSALLCRQGPWLQANTPLFLVTTLQVQLLKHQD